MNRFSVGTAATFVAAFTISTLSAQSPAPAAAKAKPPARVEMTIDSIMRGPDLVGYPPSGLRWSGDSSKLYFEWRQSVHHAGRRIGHARHAVDRCHSASY